MKYNQKHFLNKLDTQSDEYRRRGTKKRKHKLFKDTSKEENSDKHVSVNDNQKIDENSWRVVLNKNIGNKHGRNNVVKKLENHVNQLANIIINKLRSMRRFEDFAHHDNMDSIGEADFEKNLRNFRAKDNQRRRMDLVDKEKRHNMETAEREILLHYGFPIHMKIEGFLVWFLIIWRSERAS